MFNKYVLHVHLMYYKPEQNTKIFIQANEYWGKRIKINIYIINSLIKFHTFVS